MANQVIFVVVRFHEFAGDIHESTEKIANKVKKSDLKSIRESHEKVVFQL